MKKYIYAIPMMAAVALSSCSAEEGTEPGTDAMPAVTVYTYTPSDPELNPDNDVTVRFATNSATRDVYYLVDDADEVEKFIEEKGEEAYVQKVVGSGEKISVDGAQNTEITLTDIHGLKMISAVAVGGVPGKRGSGTFLGLDWQDVTPGSIIYNQSFIAAESAPCTLQICTTDETLYRIKDAFGDGYSVKLQMIDKQGQDEDGVYTLFRIPATDTSFAVNLQNAPNTPLWVQDIGYWQGDASFVTDITGYENGMYEDGSAFLNFAWMAGSAGCVSYTSPSFFLPD